MQALHPLQGMVENFVQSKEVKETLASIFTMLGRVSNACIEVGSMIGVEITNWLKTVYRHLKASMRAWHPWRINFT